FRRGRTSSPTKTARLSGGHRPPLQKSQQATGWTSYVPSPQFQRTRPKSCARGTSVLRLEQLWARQFFSLVSPFFLLTRIQLFRVDLLFGIETVLTTIEQWFLLRPKLNYSFERSSHFTAKTLQRSHPPFC